MAETNYKFHDTTHSKERGRERSISVEIMQNVVKYPDSKRQQYRGIHGGFVYKFIKTIGTDTIAVAAEVKKDECWLVSAFKL